MPPSRIAPFTAAAALALVASAATAAPVLNVDFNGAEFSDVGPTYAGQGAIAATGDTWNGLSGSAPSSAALVYSDGTAAAGVTVGTPRPGFGAFSYNFGAEHHDLIQEGILIPGWSSDHGEVRIAGLDPAGLYALAVYSQGFAADRRTQFSVNGGPAQVTTGYAGSGTTLDAGEDYLTFANLSPIEGALVIRYQKADGSAEANFSGFQLAAAVPEPAAAALAAPLAGLLARRRR